MIIVVNLEPVFDVALLINLCRVVGDKKIAVKIFLFVMSFVNVRLDILVILLFLYVTAKY